MTDNAFRTHGKKFKKAMKTDGKLSGEQVATMMKHSPKKEKKMKKGKKMKAGSTVSMEGDMKKKTAKKRKSGPTIGDEDVEKKTACKMCSKKKMCAKHATKKKLALA